MMSTGGRTAGDCSGMSVTNTEESGTMTGATAFDPTALSRLM